MARAAPAAGPRCWSTLGQEECGRLGPVTCPAMAHHGPQLSHRVTPGTARVVLPASVGHWLAPLPDLPPYQLEESWHRVEPRDSPSRRHRWKGKPLSWVKGTKSSPQCGGDRGWGCSFLLGLRGETRPPLWVLLNTPCQAGGPVHSPPPDSDMPEMRGKRAKLRGKRSQLWHTGAERADAIAGGLCALRGEDKLPQEVTPSPQVLLGALWWPVVCERKAAAACPETRPRPLNAPLGSATLGSLKNKLEINHTWLEHRRPRKDPGAPANTNTDHSHRLAAPSTPRR